MPNDDQAAKAIAGLDGKESGGRILKVNVGLHRLGCLQNLEPCRNSSVPRTGFGALAEHRSQPSVALRKGGRGDRFSTEDYRDSARQPREPRW